MTEIFRQTIHHKCGETRSKVTLVVKVWKYLSARSHIWLNNYLVKLLCIFVKMTVLWLMISGYHHEDHRNEDPKLHFVSTGHNLLPFLEINCKYLYL